MNLHFGLKTLILLSLPSALAADGASSQALLTNFLPLVLVGLFFYFIVIRPQQQEQQTIDAVQSSIKVKQEILTQFGVCGVVERVKDDWIEIAVNADNRIWIQRNQILKALPNGTLKQLNK